MDILEELNPSQREAVTAIDGPVLALAQGAAPPQLDAHVAPPEPAGLTCLGLVGMIDPLREGVEDAVADVHSAGVKTMMKGKMN